MGFKNSVFNLLKGQFFLYLSDFLPDIYFNTTVWGE